MTEFTLHEYGATPRVLSMHLPSLQRRGLEAMGIHWHRYFRPKHFTPSGAKEYGYTRRKGEGGSTGTKSFWGSYMGRKLRFRHHQNPLEWSGESKQRTRVRDVRATRNRVRVVMNAPALNFKNPSSRIDMRDELTVISPPEKTILAQVFREEFDRGVLQIYDTQTTKVR